KRIMGIGHLPLFRSFIWKNYLSKPKFVQSWLEQIGFTDASNIDPKTVRAFSVCASLPGADRPIWSFLRGHLSTNLSERLETLLTPTSILWPKGSEFFPEEEAQAILKK